MKQLLQDKAFSLRHLLEEAGDLSGRSLFDEEASISLAELVNGSALYGRGEELGGKSVLVATRGQLTTAAVLMELDGLARRIVLCLPDLPSEQLSYVMETADVDAIVSDRTGLPLNRTGPLYFSSCSSRIEPNARIEGGAGAADFATEWVLLTSGTTGVPKLVAHTLESLTGAILPLEKPSSSEAVWSTFYDIRRYGGLQIVLRAMLAGNSMVLSSPSEPTSDFLARVAAHNVTHISGTPSHWRRALMSSAAQLIQPRYVRLSGEIADQPLLNQLRAAYPEAQIAHAFASTEAGVAFDVRDGQAGIPVEAIETTPNVEMKVEDRTLRIRSARTARCYLGAQAPRLKAEDGFVDTGDIVELRGDRYYFSGRRDGVINVGGLKVYPEEIEAVINRHPEVRMSLVRAKKSPITGSIVVAEVVLREDAGASGRKVADINVAAIKEDILLLCRESLAAFKIPAAIQVVSALGVTAAGKTMRRHA